MMPQSKVVDAPSDCDDDEDFSVNSSGQSQASFNAELSDDDKKGMENSIIHTPAFFDTNTSKIF